MIFRTASRWGAALGSALAWCLLTVAAASADAPAVTAQPVEAVCPVLSLEQLACMSWCDLEQLYRHGSAGPIPTGYMRGRAIYCPGAFLTPARTKMTKVMWHGKHFCADDGILTNQWGMGIKAVHAQSLPRHELARRRPIHHHGLPRHGYCLAQCAR